MNDTISHCNRFMHSNIIPLLQFDTIKCDFFIWRNALNFDAYLKTIEIPLP